MAYYLYKKTRDKHKSQSNPEALENLSSFGADGNETSGDSKTADMFNQPDQNANIQRNQEEKRAMRRYRWRIIAGLFLPVTIHALNLTMVAGALPFIASDFRKYHSSVH